MTRLEWFILDDMSSLHLYYIDTPHSFIQASIHMNNLFYLN